MCARVCLWCGVCGGVEKPVVWAAVWAAVKGAAFRLLPVLLYGRPSGLFCVAVWVAVGIAALAALWAAVCAAALAAACAETCL